jgi:branched-chain amino acid transport system permease protein
LAPRRLTAARVAWAVAVLALAALPAVLSLFQVVRLTVFMVFCLLALSLDLIWGFAGILSFGQAAFFGVGGYAYGVVGINTGVTTLALAAAAGAAAVLAALLGYFTFYGRVGAMYFAVITLTVTLILHQVMGSTADPRYAIGAARLGGYNGMTNIPSLALELPGRPPLMLEPVPLFYAVAALLVLVLALCGALVRSRFGRVLAAIREDEGRTELLGYDVRWRKLVVFVLSGAVAGLAGGLFTGWGNFINPQVFSLSQSALVVIWVMVGGRGTLYGAIGGAFVVQYLTSYLGAASVTYTTVALGLVLVVIVLLFPRGLVPGLLAAARRLLSTLAASRTLALPPQPVGGSPGRGAGPRSEESRARASRAQSDEGRFGRRAEPPSEGILEARNLVKEFGGLRAVDGVDFTLRRGELRCLIGPNGAGKSTFFHLLAGTLKPTAGSIRFNGRDLTRLLPFQIARAGIGIKFQVPRVYDQLTVAENIWLSANFRHGRAGAGPVVERILQEIRFTDRASTLAAHLAHGDRQWVEIGMVLAADPELILLDEPTAGMTRVEARRTADLVREINRRASLIVVEHDMDFVRELGAGVTVLHRGAVLAEGAIDAIRDNEAVRDVYLGKRHARG